MSMTERSQMPHFQDHINFECQSISYIGCSIKWGEIRQNLVTECLTLEFRFFRSFTLGACIIKCSCNILDVSNEAGKVLILVPWNSLRGGNFVNFEFNLFFLWKLICCNYSPVVPEYWIFFSQFEDIGSHGTKVLIYNLWLNDEGIYELSFDDDSEVYRLWEICFPYSFFVRSISISLTCFVGMKFWKCPIFQIDPMESWGSFSVPLSNQWCFIHLISLLCWIFRWTCRSPCYSIFQDNLWA